MERGGTLLENSLFFCGFGSLHCCLQFLVCQEALFKHDILDSHFYILLQMIMAYLIGTAKYKPLRIGLLDEESFSNFGAPALSLAFC